MAGTIDMDKKDSMRTNSLIGYQLRLDAGDSHTIEVISEEQVLAKFCASCKTCYRIK